MKVILDLPFVAFDWNYGQFCHVAKGVVVKMVAPGPVEPHTDCEMDIDSELWDLQNEARLRPFVHLLCEVRPLVLQIFPGFIRRPDGLTQPIGQARVKYTIDGLSFLTPQLRFRISNRRQWISDLQSVDSLFDISSLRDWAETALFDPSAQ